MILGHRPLEMQKGPKPGRATCADLFAALVKVVFFGCKMQAKIFGLLFFCGAKKNNIDGAAGEKKLGYSVKMQLLHYRATQD